MKKPYVMEPLLFQRVKKFMEENKKIDIEDMTDYLIANYRDFKHKKKGPFMHSIKKVYQWESYMNSQSTVQEPNSLEDAAFFEVDKNGEDNDIVEIPMKNGTPSRKNKGFSLDSMYKSAGTPSDNAEKTNTGKSSKRKREANDSMIINEIKKKRANIERLTFQYDSVKFQGLQYLPIDVYTIPSFFAGDDWPSLPKSVLFTGPVGSGKSLLVEYYASTCEVPLFRVSISSANNNSLNNGMTFMEEVTAEAFANDKCIIHITGIDDVFKKETGSNRGADKRLYDQIVNAIEEVNKSDKTVLLIAEARMPEQIDSVLLSKFQSVINFPVLCEEARLLILKKLCEEHALNIEENDFNDVVERTSCFVAGDLKKLVEVTSLEAWKRVLLSHLSKEEIDNLSIKEYMDKYLRNVVKPNRKMQVILEDFHKAFSNVTPTLKAEGFPRPSDIKWEHIGGLEDVKKQIRKKIVYPIKKKRKYTSIGIKEPRGILMYGPPGCGKTMLAEAIANEAGLNFLSVKGPELLNMYQGESERGIREVFGRARRVAPSIVFFDEFDGLCQNRVKSMDSGSRHTIVNTLLAEMNGFGVGQEVYVIAATNIPEVVDPAILRPGRIDMTLYVGLPDSEGITAIIKAYSKRNGIRLGSDVNFEEISALCKNFTGADCKNLVQTACEAILDEVDPDENIGNIEIEDNEVCHRHFKIALKEIGPSVTTEDRKKFLKMKDVMDRRKKGEKPILVDIN